MAHILVLEDDPDLRNLYTRALAHKGYEITSADAAEKAIDLIHKTGLRPDLALLDMSMPGLPGTAVVEYIRRHSRIPDLPIIVASCNEDFRQELRWASILFMKKPIDLRDLYHRVAEQLTSAGV